MAFFLRRLIEKTLVSQDVALNGAQQALDGLLIADHSMSLLGVPIGWAFSMGVKTSEVETNATTISKNERCPRFFFEGSHLKYFMVETSIFL